VGPDQIITVGPLDVIIPNYHRVATDLAAFTLICVSQEARKVPRASKSDSTTEV
jgi:hypothetical protein